MLRVRCPIGGRSDKRLIDSIKENIRLDYKYCRPGALSPLFVHFDVDYNGDYRYSRQLGYSTRRLYLYLGLVGSPGSRAPPSNFPIHVFRSATLLVLLQAIHSLFFLFTEMVGLGEEQFAREDHGDGIDHQPNPVNNGDNE